MSAWRAAWLVFALLVCVASPLAAQDTLQPVPALQTRVTDLTGTLDAAQIASLNAELEALQRRKGSQLAVLMLPSTQPEDIASYAIRVFDAWKLGRMGIDDGVLLVVAKQDRQVRIEVARGLEGAIPDAAAARIIREYIGPRFRHEDYYGGIQDATVALAKLIDGEPLPEPWAEPESGQGMDGVFNALLFAFFAALWTRSLFSRSPAGVRGGLVGSAAGVVGWLVSGLVPLGLGVGALAALFGFVGGGGGGFANRGGWGGFGGGGGGGWGGGGGGFGGGGGGWGGSGGGGGGGGFSGGGGVSAGGGASGRW